MARRLLPMLGLLLLSLPAFAQVQPVPSLLNFQGRLTKPDGTPVADGNYMVEFSLWTAATNGTEKWNQTVSALAVRNGTFAVLLKNFPASTFDSNLWLEIRVGDNLPLSPRQQLASIAYAQKAQLALTVPNASITGANIANGTITANKLASGLSLPPNGTAGGDLTGTYPSPSLATLFTSLAKVSGGLASVLPGGLQADQSQTQNDVTFPTDRLIQSFRAGSAGRLAALDVYMGLDQAVTPQQGILRIYSGDGINGTLLTAQPVLISGPPGWRRFLIATPVTMIKNEAYTFQLTVSNSGLMVMGKANNAYENGTLNGDPVADAAFTTYIEGQNDPSIHVTSDLTLNGKLGIGTLSPQAALHIGDISGITIGQNTTTGGYTGLTIGLSSLYNGSAKIQAVKSAGSQYGDLILNHLAGNVGIGTDAPAARLDINGHVQVRGGLGIGTPLPNAPLQVIPKERRYAYFGYGTANTLGMSIENHPIYSNTMRIQAAVEGSNWGDIHLNPLGGSIVLGGPGSKIGVGGIPTSTARMQVGGNLFVEGTISSASDRRFKENIHPIADALDAVTRLQGVTYQWNAEKRKNNTLGQGMQYGFIAQELQQVLPELVNKNDEGYLSVNYTGVTPILVEAVKTLKRENDRKDAELKEVKARLETLMQRLERLEQNTNNR